MLSYTPRSLNTERGKLGPPRTLKHGTQCCRHVGVRRNGQAVGCIQSVAMLGRHRQQPARPLLDALITRAYRQVQHAWNTHVIITQGLSRMRRQPQHAHKWGCHRGHLSSRTGYGATKQL